MKNKDDVPVPRHDESLSEPASPEEKPNSPDDAEVKEDNRRNIFKINPYSTYILTYIML